MMLVDRFTITYDYLCPFARIANEAVAEALEHGASYEVVFAPFSLHVNSHGDEGAFTWPDATDDLGSGMLALLWSVAVRDRFPDSFLRFHVALFAARHDDGVDITVQANLSAVAGSAGLDPAAIAELVASGEPMVTLETEHTALVNDYDVFGVPTFIAGGEAVFVRFMERHRLDDLQRVLDMLTWTNLNEFKRTRIDR